MCAHFLTVLTRLLSKSWRGDGPYRLNMHMPLRGTALHWTRLQKRTKSNVGPTYYARASAPASKLLRQDALWVIRRAAHEPQKYWGSHLPNCVTYLLCVNFP